MNNESLNFKNIDELNPKKESRFIRFSICFTCIFILYGLTMMVSWSSISSSGQFSLFGTLLVLVVYALFGGVIAAILPTIRKIIYLPVSFVLTKLFVKLIALIPAF